MTSYCKLEASREGFPLVFGAQDSVFSDEASGIDLVHLPECLLPPVFVPQHAGLRVNASGIDFVISSVSHHCSDELIMNGGKKNLRGGKDNV